MSGMASFLAGFGGGYLKADRQKTLDERQAKIDAQATELHTARMADIIAAQDERQRVIDQREATKTALSAGRQDSGFQITDGGGSNAFTKDADAAAFMADLSAAKNAGTQTTDATRVSTGASGATRGGTVSGNQVFTDPKQAQEFAKTQTMSEYQKLVARQKVAEDYGDMVMGDDIKAKLIKLQSDGVFQALAKAKMGDFDGAIQTYNSTGASKLPDGSRIIGTKVEDPKTKKSRDVLQVVGPDGKVINPDIEQAAKSYLSPSDMYKLGNDERRLDVAEQTAETARLAQIANEKKIDGMIAGLIGGRSRGGGGESSGGSNGAGKAQDGLPDPMSGFDSKRAQITAQEIAVGELSTMGQNGKPATPQAIAKRATEIYREMEREFQATGVNNIRQTTFRGISRRAQTPAELSDVFSNGLQRGYTAQEMVALDPRLEQFAQPKQTTQTTQTNKASTTPPLPPKPAYVPPANSPAGKAAANRAALEAQSMQKMQATTNAALAAIQSGDPIAADAVRGMPGFMSLPREQKAQIQKIIFGR